MGTVGALSRGPLTLVEPIHAIGALHSWRLGSFSGETTMADDVMETMDCPVCGGDGFIACDDGSEVQCERCNGTGRVPIKGDGELMA